MSRELEKVTRVEGKTFPTPLPVATPKKDEGTKEPDSSRWTSAAAVASAARRLKHFYPKDTEQLAVKILEAAAPHMKITKRATNKSITDKAVEAAGEVIYSTETQKNDWLSLEDRLRWVYKEDAKGTLETVVLHLNISSK